VNRRCNNNQHWSRYDWNVEENYFGLSRANRGNLLGSLSHGLLSTLPAMEDNAIQLINATVGSGAMLIAQGYGENMIASTLANGALLNASAVAASDAAGTHQPGIMRGVAFSAHVIWRACHADLNISCINEEVLPLLRGAISTYALYTFTEEEKQDEEQGQADDGHRSEDVGMIHLRDVGWDSSTAPKGVQQVKAIPHTRIVTNSQQNDCCRSIACFCSPTDANFCSWMHINELCTGQQLEPRLPQVVLSDLPRNQGHTRGTTTQTTPPARSSAKGL
jgi:hypothetical protein